MPHQNRPVRRSPSPPPGGCGRSASRGLLSFARALALLLARDLRAGRPSADWSRSSLHGPPKRWHDTGAAPGLGTGPSLGGGRPSVGPPERCRSRTGLPACRPPPAAPQGDPSRPEPGYHRGMRRCCCCLAPIVGRRVDARTCSGRCRERLRRWRARWLVPALADLQLDDGADLAAGLDVDAADQLLDRLALPRWTGRADDRR